MSFQRQTIAGSKLEEFYEENNRGFALRFRVASPRVSIEKGTAQVITTLREEMLNLKGQIDSLLFDYTLMLIGTQS